MTEKIFIQVQTKIKSCRMGNECTIYLDDFLEYLEANGIDTSNINIVDDDEDVK